MRGARTTHDALQRPDDVPSDADLEAAHARIGKVHRRRRIYSIRRGPKKTRRCFASPTGCTSARETATVKDQLLFQFEGQNPTTAGCSKNRSESCAEPATYRTPRFARWHGTSGVVDVDVITTTDVWTLNPGVSFGRKGGKNTTGVGIEELNLLGLGTPGESRAQVR